MRLKPNKLTQVRSEHITNRETYKFIHESIKPISLLCKITGLNPNHKSSAKIQYIYIASYLILYTFLGLYSIATLITSSQFDAPNKYTLLIQYVVLLIVLNVLVAVTFYSRGVIAHSIDILSHIDASFFKNSFVFDYKNLQKRNYTILAYLLISATTRTIFHSFSESGNFLQHLAVAFATLVKAGTNFMFIALVLQLQVRYAKINQVIMAFYEQKTRLIMDPGHATVKEQLYVLCRLHYKLANVIQKINSAFAIQLLVSIGVSLGTILFEAYCLYLFATRKEESGAAKVISPILYLFNENFEIYWLVYACATTCDHANETPVLLHEMRNKAFDVRLENEVQTYSLQMLHQKVQFSVLGFFVVDYTLIYSILGAVTTYLVIFIQFDQTSSTEKAEINATVTPQVQ